MTIRQKQNLIKKTKSRIALQSFMGFFFWVSKKDLFSVNQEFFLDKCDLVDDGEILWIKEKQQ